MHFLSRHNKSSPRKHFAIFTYTIYFIYYILVGCSSSPSISTQIAPLHTMAFPTVTFAPSTYIPLGSGFTQMQPLHLYLVLSQANSSTVSHIVFEDAVVGGITLNTYAVIAYNPAENLYIALSFPQTINIGQHIISRALNASYSSMGESAIAAIIRSIPLPIEGLGEPETAGVPCNLNISGALNIDNLSPLQGSFQFSCRFADGNLSNAAGAFSQ